MEKMAKINKHRATFIRDLRVCTRGIYRFFRDCKQKFVFFPHSYKATLGTPLEQTNYFKRFSLLLHCEELQMELDIRNYDMEVSETI